MSIVAFSYVPSWRFQDHITIQHQILDTSSLLGIAISDTSCVCQQMATQESTEFLTRFTYHSCRQEANTQPDSNFRELHCCSLIGLCEENIIHL